MHENHNKKNDYFYGYIGKKCLTLSNNFIESPYIANV